ncbi:energy transducer TonB [Sulfuricurvum sp.]|uniref:energy transducer TonB n=1 Tax=Sulfuricurvum sp. TaxID=2025608 RepID=UPI003C325BCD
MNSTRKSFLLSLIFHALMGTSAFFVLTQMHTPPTLLHTPIQSMMLVSLSNPAPVPKQQEIAEEMTRITPSNPPKPIKPLIAPQTLPPQALKPQPTAIPTQAVASTAPSAVPVVSAPPLVQHRIPTAPSAEVVQTPPKRSSDLAAEKRSFFASLRSTIQNHLRYPTAARRRGMEGEVGVRFTLGNDGTIDAITVQRGDAIFHNAAKTAVASASGIDVPKNLTDSLPMEIELTLEFKLNG